MAPPKRPGAAAAGAPATAAIDEYLEGLSPDLRGALQSLRQVIAAAAPAAEEAISYGAPAFRYRGHPLVAYAAAKAHASFFPMNPAILDAHRAELGAFALAKGTVRFSPDAPLPADVVTSIVRARLAELDGR